MAFSDSTIKQAWERSGGRCECRGELHEHGYSRCGRQLIFEKRGQDTQGGWHARRKKPTGNDDLGNCQICCWDCFGKVV